MIKETKKIIITISVVALFFCVTLSPVISAENDNNKDHQLNVLMQDMTEKNEKFTTKISNEQLEEVNDSLKDLIILIDDSMDEHSTGGLDISVSEWQLIKTKINAMIDLIAGFLGENFPADNTKTFVNTVINGIIKNRYFLRQPILSIGIGITWIPFYEYETMIGTLIKPILIHHFLGVSATCKLFPLAHGFPTVKYGLHRMRTFFFSGLLIDFTDLGYKRIIGPQILIGFGVFTGFG